jgi:4-hydroxy-3-methylbut-2-enyl diphosphate reductase IspH
VVLSQTTQNWEEVKKIFEEIKKNYKNAKFSQSSDVCKATFERQSVIKNNEKKFDSIVII